jgi:CheY-like chemotaxis protein
MTLASSPEPAAPGSSGYRVLVVDDNLDGADTLSMLLELSGYKVRSVYDGLTALKAVDEFHPHAIVLDIGLPGLDGYEVARRVRGSQTDIVLIALTGYGQESDRERSRLAGFDHHFVKPTDPHTLCDILQRCAAIRQASQSSPLP